MIYERFIECLDLCNNHIDEGGGKITNVVLRDFILPDNIKELIKENHIIVRNLVVFYYNDFTLRIPYYNSPDEILNSMEFIKIKSKTIPLASRLCPAFLVELSFAKFSKLLSTLDPKTLILSARSPMAMKKSSYCS